MRSWPLRGRVLVGALVALTIVVLSVLAWAGLSGRAGSQRGLVIHSELAGPIEVTVAGESKIVTPDDEETFVVRRNQFPGPISWTANTPILSSATSGTPIADGRRDVSYDFLADAEFRLSIDENGLYPTSTYRDTPVPGRTEAP